MIKKIKSLTNVFIKSFYQNFKIYNEREKRVEKKSVFFWAIVIIAITMFYISHKIIDAVVVEGQPGIFLNLYFLILFVFLTFQSILISTNVYFFSKDIEFILPMPVSSLELLIAKFNTLLSMLYITEAIFGVIPLLMYGIEAKVHLWYYILMFIALFIFPILIVTVVSIITIFLMKFAKFLKNKQFFQTLVTLILTICMLFVEILLLNNFSKISEQNIDMVATQQIDVNLIQQQYNNLTKDFLIINPTIEILGKDTSFLGIISNLLKLIGYNALAIFVFILIGRKGYVKNILDCAVRVKNDKNKKVKIKYQKDNNTKNRDREYIKKEIKNLFRHPIFFIQNVLPVLIIIISIVNIASFIIPAINSALERETTITEALNSLTFNLEMSCVILCALQFLFSISGLSLTAISREGRDAILMKYIPVDLYKQFLYKNVLQVFLNLIISIIILGCIYYLIPVIGFTNILLMFIISLFINLINSYAMVIVDLRRPNLNWDSEYIVIKKNPNKIFQYGFMILDILFLMYLANIFQEFNINITVALISQIFIFFIIFTIIDILVRKYKNTLFNKII